MLSIIILQVLQKSYQLNKVTKLKLKTAKLIHTDPTIQKLYIFIIFIGKKNIIIQFQL